MMMTAILKYYGVKYDVRVRRQASHDFNKILRVKNKHVRAEIGIIIIKRSGMKKQNKSNDRRKSIVLKSNRLEADNSLLFLYFPKSGLRSLFVHYDVAKVRTRPILQRIRHPLRFRRQKIPFFHELLPTAQPRGVILKLGPPA